MRGCQPRWHGDFPLGARVSRPPQCHHRRHIWGRSRRSGGGCEPLSSRSAQCSRGSFTSSSMSRPFLPCFSIGNPIDGRPLVRHGGVRAKTRTPRLGSDALFCHIHFACRELASPPTSWPCQRAASSPQPTWLKRIHWPNKVTSRESQPRALKNAATTYNARRTNQQGRSMARRVPPNAHQQPCDIARCHEGEGDDLEGHCSFHLVNQARDYCGGSFAWTGSC